MSLDIIFLDFFTKCKVPETDSFIKNITNFKDFLTQENSTHNLTRIEDDTEFWNKHIADSLSIAAFFPEISEKEISVLDIGCGAGFPSFVLAAAFSNLKITAIDSIGKKINFLSEAANVTGIKNLSAINVRSKEFKTNNKYDIITARAVAEPFKIFKESKKFLSEDGKYILYRTPENYVNDLADINKLTLSVKFKWSSTQEFELPAGNGKRLFFVGKKFNE